MDNHGQSRGGAAPATQVLGSEEPSSFPLRLECDALVEEAAKIGRAIVHRAYQDKAGVVTWDVEPRYWQQAGAGKVTRYDLYGGVLGIVLFLAALDHARNTDEHRNTIDAALLPIRQLAATEIDDWLQTESVAAGTGAMSIIYSLWRIGNFTPDPWLNWAAVRGVHRLQLKTSARIPFDLMGGAAGCIMVLALLYRGTGEPGLLDKAIEYGWYLLESRTADKAGLRSWETSPGKCQTGYAHGAAGIAHSLCLLFELTGEVAFKEAAVEAIQYENTLYREDQGNWPHILCTDKDGRYECWNSWCNGAPGIGLGRLGCIGALGLEFVAQDIARALHANMKSGPHGHLDIPCCGTLGRVEFLQEASTQLKDDRYRNAAITLAAAAIARAARRGNYGLGDGKRFPSLTFHKGLAGVGYQLLRVGVPEKMPSILTWA